MNKNDHIVSNHRGHGHYLSRFKDIEGLIAEVMGKRSGCSGGYGGSQHLFNNNFLSKNYHHLKNYFTLEKKDLEINGFKIFDQFILPSKIYRQVGVVILKKLI